LNFCRGTENGKVLASDHKIITDKESSIVWLFAYSLTPINTSNIKGIYEPVRIHQKIVHEFLNNKIQKYTPILI
jgi:hypothetical protein